MSKEEAENLEKEIDKLNKALKEKTHALQTMQLYCRHVWSEPVYKPIITEAYTIPADAPGTMGVDWRPECHVPRRVDKLWERKCINCRKTETTTTTKQVDMPGTINGCMSKQEVPNFYGDHKFV